MYSYVTVNGRQRCYKVKVVLWSSSSVDGDGNDLIFKKATQLCFVEHFVVHVIQKTNMPINFVQSVKQRKLTFVTQHEVIGQNIHISHELLNILVGNPQGG